MSGRRAFIKLAAVALIVPVELFRGRSQVAVGKVMTMADMVTEQLLRRRWVAVRDECVNPFCCGIDWDRSFEEDLRDGFDQLLRSTGQTPKTVWFHPETFKVLQAHGLDVDGVKPFP